MFRVAVSARSPFLQNLKRGQRLAFQHFQKRTAAGRDVIDLAFNAVLGNRGYGVTAACE